MGQNRTLPQAASAHNPQVTRWMLIALVGLALILHLWGVRRTLPFAREVDEDIFVEAAVRIAASGNLNPGWFGNPGSTVIYPLAALYRIWYAIAHRGMFFHPDPYLQARFNSAFSEFYLLARFLTIGYAIMSILLVYLIGQRVWRAEVGLVGSWFAAICPIAVGHARLVRTDSPATFFGLLALWLCLRLYDQPTVRNQIWAGLAIGLGIATRYFMVVLVPALLVTDGLILWQRVRQRHRLANLWPGIVAGLVTIGIAFALSTPCFFLDLNTALLNLKAEARSTQLGADGLPPIGNFVWYLTDAIPYSFAWPRVAFAVVGIGLAIYRRRLSQILLAGFTLVFLMATSLHSLHWRRWVIEILPLLALFAADGLYSLTVRLSTQLRLKPSGGRGLVLGAIVLISAWPTYRLILLDIQHSTPNTGILAREWILQNLPTGSPIAEEWTTAPLMGTDFPVLNQYALAAGHTVEDYYRAGYRYIIINGAIYELYAAESDRYPSEMAFYETLFTKEELLQAFKPSATRGGPTIQIYRLRDRN